MARGQQKIQSQQKAAEKAAKLKKQVGWLTTKMILYIIILFLIRSHCSKATL